ncbi:type I restriction endonuclease subunit S, partial [Mycoplasmopsis pullorum]
MALKKIKIGKLIAISEDKNTDNKYSISDVKGISIQKKFIETKADMEGVSLRSYLVVKPDDFAYVTVTSRNGEKITLAHNTTEDTYIVSSSYVVFSVVRKDILLPDYLFMYFNRPEFDRYSRFNSWGSARETFSWEEMCDIDFELPPIEIQRKYVEIYNGLVDNQIAYKTGLEDLKLVCDGFVENLKKTVSTKPIGQFIEELSEKNDGSITLAQGVDVNLQFIPAKREAEDKESGKIV